MKYSLRKIPMSSDQPHQYPIVPGLIFLLFLLGLLILPEVVRLLVVPRLQARLTTPIVIKDLDLNLVTGKARVSNLVFGSKHQPILYLPMLDLNFSRRALLDKELIIHTAVASRPELYLEKTGPDQWKLPRIIRPRAERNGFIRKFTIKGFEAHNAQITIVDHTTTPAVKSILQDVHVTLRPVTRKPDRVSLDLKGTLKGSSLIQLHGWFTTSKRPLRVIIEGTVQDYELSRLNPYAEKYVGHYVRRGRATNKFRYRYDGGTLKFINDIQIRQAQVGPALNDEFQRHVGIPLELAIALLEDAQGEIRLRVLAQGNVNSPEFQVGGVVWKGVRNAVLKSLVAPFRLLGHILTLGGKISDVQINPVSFKPGSLTPDPQAEVQLQRLIKFLRNRPRVDLQLRGRASRQETRALARQRPRARRVTERDLRTLAERRVRLIERTLVRRGVASKRLFVVTGDTDAVTGQGSGRVDFRLLN